MSGGLLLVVLITCSLASAQWIPVSPDDIKRAAPTDIIDIVHLEAPLCMASIFLFTFQWNGSLDLFLAT